MGNVVSSAEAAAAQVVMDAPRECPVNHSNYSSDSKSGKVHPPTSQAPLRDGSGGGGCPVNHVSHAIEDLSPYDVALLLK